jgi:hypothetical protein
VIKLKLNFTFLIDRLLLDHDTVLSLNIKFQSTGTPEKYTEAGTDTNATSSKDKENVSDVQSNRYETPTTPVRFKVKIKDRSTK